ncbi:hypothetical protein [Streptomyces orinoci]|uniref:Uncharacterized protein n=1 Tax=Streptomyces orinoci TaxID=67339 RepID=A0ABV3JTX8_STRON|nr:hypothetical protein [Streptomyces orinoci]
MTTAAITPDVQAAEQNGAIHPLGHALRAIKAFASAAVDVVLLGQHATELHVKR